VVTNGEKPQARPLFRKLALGLAIVLFLLAAVFGLAPTDNDLKLKAGGPCLFVGYVMLTIGIWPPPPSGIRTKPQARPLFRKLALGMAFVCFLLAALVGLDPTDHNFIKWVGGGSCLFVGFVMLTIGKTGFWPPPAKR
jgi:hypothetical protein